MNEAKIIVMMRLDNGDKILCSAKKLGTDAKMELWNGVLKKMEPHIGDALYFTVRTTLGGRKDNYRVSTIDELEDLLNEIFS